MSVSNPITALPSRAGIWIPTIHRETNYGHWTYQDGRFTVTTVSDDPVPDTEILAFIPLPDNRIALADDDNQVQENYIFDKAKPMTAADFTGTYRQGGMDKAHTDKAL